MSRRGAYDEPHGGASASGSGRGGGASGGGSSSSWRTPAFRDSRQYSPPAGRGGARHDAYDDGAGAAASYQGYAAQHTRWDDGGSSAPAPLNSWRGAQQQQSHGWAGQQPQQSHSWAAQRQHGDWHAPPAAHGWGEPGGQGAQGWAEQRSRHGYASHGDQQYGGEGQQHASQAGAESSAAASRQGRYQPPGRRHQQQHQQPQRGFASSAPGSSDAPAPSASRGKARQDRGGRWPSASKPLPLRERPRDWYLDAVASSPRCFPASLESPPGPLPLLILDLNGTLVYRASASKSANPTRRPYLGSFLHWALGVQAHEGGGSHSRAPQWEAWDEARAEREAEGADESTALPHGVEFWPSTAERASASASAPQSTPTQMWRSHPSEPQPTASSRFRLLLWSSAQPKNVAAMARAIFSPAQAAHLLRVWARDTLMPRRYMDAKASSTKDLEIVWAALNGDGGAEGDVQASAEEQEAREMQLEGERRLLAQHRSEVDAPGAMASSGGEASSPAAATAAAIAAERYVQPPASPPLLEGAGHENDAQAWTPGRGYSAHNTLLLDDSPEKARLQPYNHLLLPEFDARRAALMVRWLNARKAEARSVPQEEEPQAQEEEDVKPGSTSEHDDTSAAAAASASPAAAAAEAEASSKPKANKRPFRPAAPAPHESELDDVLLQLVGVLAHARRQRHVAAWVRSGGLGFFGGMAQPGMQDAEPPVDEDAQEQDETMQTDSSEEQTQLRLQHAPHARTQRFWAQEGRLALRLAGVECAV
jgi:hypothetical protein